MVGRHHATYRFAEEDNVGLDEATTVATFDDVPGFDAPLHRGAVERRFAVDAVLGCEAAVRLDYPVAGDAGLALEGVDVLCEAGIEEAVVREELHKGVRERRPKLAWVELSGKGVDWRRSLSADANIVHWGAKSTHTGRGSDESS